MNEFSCFCLVKHVRKSHKRTQVVKILIQFQKAVNKPL